MDKRWIFAAGLVPALLMGSAEAKEAPVEAKTTPPAGQVKKLDVEIEVPCSWILPKPGKVRLDLSREDVHEPGDYWTPAMLQKIRRVNR